MNTFVCLVNKVLVPTRGVGWYSLYSKNNRYLERKTRKITTRKNNEFWLRIHFYIVKFVSDNVCLCS